MMRSIVLRVTMIGIFWVGSAAAGPLTGSGTWQSNSGTSIKGTWRADLTRVGDGLNGEFVVEGSPLFTGGSATGSISDDDVVLGVIVSDESEATFKAAFDGEIVNGTWELPAISDTGTWTGTLK